MNEVVVTSDNSSSVYSHRFDALYHSHHGAIQESEHVFIKSGFDHYIEKSDSNAIDILEIGFGTGLNAFLTALHSAKSQIHCNYTTLEAYPLELSILNGVNYGSLLNNDDLFRDIHACSWEKSQHVNEYFNIEKVKTLFEEYRTDKKYNVIYFDAFAPNTQAELWNEEMMKNMYSLSKKGSILVTYCAKGVVRRTLESVGYQVERIPGPPGKRQMIRATAI